jgi:hypothetical protein
VPLKEDLQENHKILFQGFGGEDQLKRKIPSRKWCDIAISKSISGMGFQNF